jgi:hypothetical protein
MNAQEYIEKETQNVHWLDKHPGRIPVVKTIRQLTSEHYTGYDSKKIYSMSLLFNYRAIAFSGIPMDNIAD